MTAEQTSPIAIFGNLNVDQWVKTVDRFPAWDEEIVVESARIELAGTAGYMLRAAIGLGMETFVVSTIGDDAFGSIVLDELTEIGADSSGVAVLTGEETCLGLIFVGPEGERAILATLGAHGDMDGKLVARHDSRIAACDDVIFCGMYLLPRLGPADVLPLARAARARGQRVWFDPSWDPAGWTDQTRTETLALLQEVDIYLPNEAELLRLTGTDSLAAALDMTTALSGEVVVKRGAEGALFASGAVRVSVPGLPIRAVNTIGAGDIFDIGYLYGRRRGWEPEQRLYFANALAANVIAQLGARQYPDATTVLTNLEDIHATRPHS
jgi:sugar/nucleoside kinase (ribokinase family)